MTNCGFTRAPLALNRFPLELITDLFSQLSTGDTNVIAAMRGEDYVYKEAMREIYKNCAVSISDIGGPPDFAVAEPYALHTVPSMHVANTYTLHIL